MRREHGRLAIETKNRSVNVWLFREDADVVRQIPCWKIIGAIDHDLVAGDNLARILTCELAFMGFDFDVRVRVAQTVARRIQFFATDVLRPMQICRWRLLRSTSSKSTKPSLPTPAAAR